MAMLIRLANFLVAHEFQLITYFAGVQCWPRHLFDRLGSVGLHSTHRQHQNECSLRSHLLVARTMSLGSGCSFLCSSKRQRGSRGKLVRRRWWIRFRYLYM